MFLLPERKSVAFAPRPKKNRSDRSLPSLAAGGALEAREG